MEEIKLVVCRCVFTGEDSPGRGGGCGCALCPSPVSVVCPGILDDRGTGEWTCSVFCTTLHPSLMLQVCSGQGVLMDNVNKSTELLLWWICQC